MKTIVIDARNKSLGSGRYITRLVEELQQVDTNLKHRYKILVRSQDADSWQLTSKRFTKVITKSRRYSMHEQLLLALKLYALRPNLVHFTSAAQPLLYFGKSITTVQELTSLRYPTDTKRLKFKAWLHRLAVRKTPRLIVPSAFVKDDIARYADINSRKIVVIHEGGSAVSATSKKVAALEGTRYITYVGRGYDHKNLPRLITAFEIVRQQYPDVVLVLAGTMDNGYKRLQRHIEKQAITGVTFTDYLTDPELKWLYEHAEAYVFPSLSEGFGLPGLEAMAHGTPVVSSDIGTLREIYGDAAVYFDPEDPVSIAGSITRLLKNPDKQQALRQAGKRRVERYSWRKMTEQTLDEYKALLHEQ